VKFGQILATLPVETLFLARHAESADPTVYHGFESDTDLGIIGLEQAQRLASRPELQQVDLLVSSGQLRSLRTLEPLSQKLGLQPRIIRSFHERKVGVLQGTSTTGPNSAYANTAQEWSKGNKDFTTQGAESYHDVRLRVQKAICELKDICQKEKARFPLVVSHGLTLKILFFEWLHDGDTTQWNQFGSIKNTALWSTDFPFKELKTKGCLAHLKSA